MAPVAERQIALSPRWKLAARREAMAWLSAETQEMLDRADKAIANSRHLLSESGLLRLKCGRFTDVIDFQTSNMGPLFESVKARRSQPGEHKNLKIR